jgi:hypothetical protein
VRLTRKRVLAAAAGVIAVVAAVTLTLILLPRNGPVTTLLYAGQPVISGGGHRARPGQQEEITAAIVSHSRDPVTLLSATAVPVRGRPVGRLTHAGVYLNGRHAVGDASFRWPPSGIRVRPLRGARIGYGRTGLLIGFTAPASPVGYTMIAGVRLRYRWHGAIYAVTAWSAGVACGDLLSPRECGWLIDQAQVLAIRQTDSEDRRRARSGGAGGG